MTSELGDGAAIARLLGEDGTTVIGYLYLWDSGDFGILWSSKVREISYVDRVLDVDILTRARPDDSAEFVEFLKGLPVKDS